MPVVIAVANLKGGVGKTTLAVNLAGALHSARRAVALVDADPQGTALAWGRAGGLPFPVRGLPLTGETRRWIAAVQSETAAVVIDLPPMLGTATAAALMVAHVAVLPVTPSGADIEATGRALQLVTKAQRERGGLPGALLVPSKVDRRTAAGIEIEAALAGFGVPVGTGIAQRVALSEAFTAGQWIGDYAPRSPSHIEFETLAATVWRMARKGARDGG